MAKNQNKITFIWSPKSFDLLTELNIYLTEMMGEQKANDYIDELIVFTENSLEPNPERYSPCRNQVLQIAGCRCLLFRKKYVIVYEFVAPSTVHILGVIHSGRSPKEFEKLI